MYLPFQSLIFYIHSIDLTAKPCSLDAYFKFYQEDYGQGEKFEFALFLWEKGLELLNCNDPYSVHILANALSQFPRAIDYLDELYLENKNQLMEMVESQLKNPTLFNDQPFPKLNFKSELNPLVYVKGKRGFITELEKLNNYRYVMSSSEEHVVITGENLPEQCTVTEREQALFHFNLHLVMAWLIHPPHIQSLQQQWEWMIDHLDQCLKMDPILARLSGILFWKGYFLYQLERYPEAINAFQTCLKEDEPFKIKDSHQEKYRYMYDAELFLSLSMLHQMHVWTTKIDMNSEFQKAMDHLNHYIDCAPSHSEFRALGVAHMIILKQMYPEIEKSMLELAKMLDDDLLTVEAWSDRDWRSLKEVSKAMDIIGPLYPLMECDLACAFNECDRIIKKDGVWMWTLEPKHPIKVSKVKDEIKGWDFEENDEEHTEVAMEPLTLNHVSMNVCSSCGLVKYCSEDCMMVEQSMDSAHACHLYQQRQEALQKFEN